jgi:hypothetical protein
MTEDEEEVRALTEAFHNCAMKFEPSPHVRAIMKAGLAIVMRAALQNQYDRQVVEEMLRGLAQEFVENSLRVFDKQHPPHRHDDPDEEPSAKAKRRLALLRGVTIEELDDDDSTKTT